MGEEQRRCGCGAILTYSGRGAPPRTCGPCQKAKAQAWLVDYRDKRFPGRVKKKPRTAAPEGCAICVRCETAKPFSEMHRRTGREKPSNVCHACFLASNRKRDQLRQDKCNPERVRRSLNIEPPAGMGYCRHCEKLHVLEDMLQRSGRSRPGNVCKACHYERQVVALSRRRARQFSAAGRYGIGDVALKRELQGDACYYCKKPLDGKGEIEHKIPLTRGGTNWPANLCLSCRSCNARKHTKTPQEFRALRSRD